MSTAKSPVFVESGRRGARKRWGADPRVIRLRDVADPELKAAYLALHRLGESRRSADTQDNAA